MSYFLTSVASPSSFHQRYGPYAVVTGASSGIGAEFARQLASRGLNIIAIARRLDRLQTLCTSLERTYGVKAYVCQADLSTTTGIEKVSQFTDQFDVGLLINNAGIAHTGPFLDAQLETSVRSMCNVNVSAVAQLTHIFLSRFLYRRSKTTAGILFISSFSSNGVPFLSLYSSTKAFVTCFAYTIAQELETLASLQPNAKVTSVHCMALEPAFVRSEMTLGENEEQYDEKCFPGIISAQRCVTDAINAFEQGNKRVYTPGIVNRIIKNILLWLPRRFALYLASKSMKKTLTSQLQQSKN